jgi:hypothetical protein
MAQVIHVRFINPSNSETVHENFALASTHEEAINLTMREFSGGIGVVKEITSLGEGKFTGSGLNQAWRHMYSCTIADDEYDRELIAMLDATFKERAIKNAAS